jgi:hypothetical protein
MARKKAERPADKPKGSKEDRDLLVRVRKRYPIMTEADKENRQKGLADLKFVHIPGEQWDANQKKERGKRPCFEFNKLRVTIKRVVNDMRANRPQGKVRAVEDGDKDTADVMEGLIRNIWNVSDADTVIDYAAEYQVGAGMGAWRVSTKYASDSVFDQDIVIEPIKNPFCLYADPAASDPIKRDANDWILTEQISQQSFKERWPDAKPVDFEEDEFDDNDDWTDNESETVRICEYWYKVPATKQLCLLSDGSTIDKSENPQLPQGVTVVRERTVKCHKVMSCIVSGDAVLEQPTEWAGSEFPFVVVYGEWLCIEGKVYWHGLTRFSKDAQRRYNVVQTAISETVASAPLSHYWATADQAKGHTDMWNKGHKEAQPFLLYNADAKAPGPPARVGGPDVPVALMQEAATASEDIKATSGIFDPSLGQQSNETSGRAIAARQRQGEIATFNFSDNMAKGIRRTYEICVGLVPKIYDTERSVRVLGVDLSEKYEKINASVFDPSTGTSKKINDLSRGKYDVTVTVGPSFATQRQEAAETYTQLAQSFPPLMQFAGDLVFKSMDVPYAEQIAERLKMMLPPPIQQQIAEGKPVPPEVQAVMQQAEAAMAQVQQHGQLVQQAAQELEAEKAQVDKGKAEIQTLIANLKTEEARFEARIAKEVANLATKEAGIAVKDAQSQATEGKAETEQERANLTGEAQAAIQTIQDLAQQFAQLAAQVMQQIDARTAETAQAMQVQQAPRRRQIRAKRVNGELVAQIDEMDETGNVVASRPARVSRQNGELVGEA